MPRQSSKSSAAMVWRWNGDPHVDSWPSLSASLCASLLDDLGDYRNWKVSSKLESHAGFDLARIQSSGGFPKIRRRHHTQHAGNIGAIECIGYVCKDVEIPGAVSVSITPVRRAEEKRFRDIEIEGERFRTRTAISGTPAGRSLTILSRLSSFPVVMFYQLGPTIDIVPVTKSPKGSRALTVLFTLCVG